MNVFSFLGKTRDCNVPPAIAVSTGRGRAVHSCSWLAVGHGLCSGLPVAHCLLYSDINYAQQGEELLPLSNAAIYRGCAAIQSSAHLGPAPSSTKEQRFLGSRSSSSPSPGDDVWEPWWAAIVVLQ